MDIVNATTLNQPTWITNKRYGWNMLLSVIYGNKVDANLITRDNTPIHATFKFPLARPSQT